MEPIPTCASASRQETRGATSIAVEEVPTKHRLIFECGAVIEPNDGVCFTERAQAQGLKPRKDGRFPLTVFSVPDPVGRPRMPDGDSAPCLWCPRKRSSGRKEHERYASDNTIGIAVSCYPREEFPLRA